jgi:hypothetical protein
MVLSPSGITLGSRGLIQTGGGQAGKEVDEARAMRHIEPATRKMMR